MISESGAALITLEREAAELAIVSKEYTLYKCTLRKDNVPRDFCARVGPNSRCYCGMFHSQHSHNNNRKGEVRCCKNFEFIPSRPEEVGETWLMNRRGFNVDSWKAKCKCGHAHTEHGSVKNRRRCKECSCSAFISNFLCGMCDSHWEDHETIIESEGDRKREGKSVNQDFIPLSEAKDLQRHVFQPTKKNTKSRAFLTASGPSPEELFESGKISATKYHAMLAEAPPLQQQESGVGMRVNEGIIRRGHVDETIPASIKCDRGVMLSHVNSGGRQTGKVNRWGKIT